MSEATELDVLGCPLRGAALIEASAGTGKTWNICGLYLRLLLERELGVRQILVVTFTNAATAELRERIRARIGDTLGYLRASGPAAADPFVPALTAALEGRGITRQRMEQLLEQALQAFDEAAIFTIHGFCQRALAETPFAAGLPFSSTLEPDDDALLQEAVNDFWRREIGGGTLTPDLATFLLERKDTPHSLARLLRRHLAKPTARCLWPEPDDGDDDDGAAVAEQIAQLFGTARTTWQAEGGAIHALLHAALSDFKSAINADKLAAACAGCDTFFAAEQPQRLKPGLHGVAMKLLGQSHLQAQLKQKRELPAHPFFQQLDQLLTELPALQQRQADAQQRARLRLLRALLEQAGPALRQRKRELRTVAYDDLLYNVHEALSGGRFPWLAATLRERYPAALIDEFQDTDPLQFGVFDAIYGGSDAPLFLVGDPKQAIYSFRNADLHTYLRAKARAGAIHTLAANQRSSAGLIDGLNALFSANPAAFMLDGLDYQQVRYGAKPRPAFVDRSGAERADLQLWMLPAEDDRILLRGAARRAAIDACAAEIARLLAAARQGEVTLDGRPLQPGDIAVLVRNHAQGSEASAALAALGIGSVELAQASVFASADAADLEAVLGAVLEPGRSGLLLAALATPLLGCDATTIAAIGADDRLLAQHLERFAAYHEMWEQRGIGFLLRQLLAEQDISRRLLARTDGERRLTNLLHLAELLHQAAQRLPAPDALLHWLQTQRNAAAAGGGSEATQLRLESDENLVQIVTIHKSKGLEYPLVFCPLLWDGRKRPPDGGDGLEYHAADGSCVIDFRCDDATIAQAKAAIDREQAAENLRLIYVALTRAAQRCYLVAGSYASQVGRNRSLKEGTHNLLNWMVAGAGMSADEWSAATLQPDAIERHWQELAQAHPAIGLAPLPDAPGQALRLPLPAPDSLAARQLTAPPPAGWRLGSFTLLSHGRAPERAASDHDADAAPTPLALDQVEAGANPAPDDILRFPRGAGAGDCLHAVFEAIDFSQPDDWPRAAAQALRAHPQAGPDDPAGRQAMIVRMLRDVLTTPLADGIRLRDIALTRRLTELEFLLPAPRLGAEALNQLLQRAGYDMPPLAFRELSGYLHGFIDLVFEHDGRYYLLDWKSNHLGWRPQDYGHAAIAAAMAAHRYHLQYLLYAVALQRHLRQRLPDYHYERHFGGVLYLFVRGVRPDWRLDDGSQAGVYFHRPDPALLAELDALLTPAPSEQHS